MHLLPGVCMSTLPASVLLNPEQNLECCSLVVVCSPMEVSGWDVDSFNVLTDCCCRLSTPPSGHFCLGISVCRETGQAGHMQFKGTQW